MTHAAQFANTTYYVAVQVRDAYIAGFMHAACGHANDEFRETYRNACVHDAWQHGYVAGTRYDGPVGWSTDAARQARQDYGHWRATMGCRESELGDRAYAHR